MRPVKHIFEFGRIILIRILLFQTALLCAVVSPQKLWQRLLSWDCGFSWIFTNAAYIGHWAVNDVVVIKLHNHLPIVDEQTFLGVFNYLSDVAATRVRT